MSEGFKKNRKTYFAPAHTAEHIVTGVMEKMFEGMKHIGSKVEKKKSKCDFTFTRNLTKEEIAQINKKVNEVIENDVKVELVLLGKEEAGKQGFDVSKIEEGETIRIVKIGDVDKQPCSGNHVESAKEIGTFNLTTSSFEDKTKVLRIRFKVKKK